MEWIERLLPISPDGGNGSLDPQRPLFSMATPQAGFVSPRWPRRRGQEGQNEFATRMELVLLVPGIVLLGERFARSVPG
jgi:hypothetical protein